jgi:hypothetical protein
MRFAAALVLTSFAAMGQAPPPEQAPPAEVDQALRARVNEFFHYHVTGEFMKAFGFVAEETKEYYFAVQKRQYISYTIGDITYSDNFTKATVNVVGKAKMRPRPEFPEIVIDQPMNTTWKIQNGQWVWYVSMTIECPTPMSCGPDGKPRVATPAPSPDAAPKMPDVSAKTLHDEAEQIRKASKVDKPIVAMSGSSPTTEHVVFHNGQPGYVRVSVFSDPKVDGFTASPEKSDLKAGEDLTVNLRYEPGSVRPPLAVTVKLYVEPLGQVFLIVVKFAK